MRRAIAVMAMVVAAVMMAGCGGSGGGAAAPGALVPDGPTDGQPGEGGGTQVYTQGNLVVETAASPDFRSVTLASPTGAGYAFVGFYGAKITRLEYRPAPGKLCGRHPVGYLKVSREDGTNAKSILYEVVGSPRWSPDGRSLAFVSSERLYLCDANGGNVRRLPACVDSAYSASWAPSGYTLYFHGSRAGVQDIFKVDPTSSTGTVWKATDDADIEGMPDVSPDGRWLAWARTDVSDFEIVMKPAGTTPPAVAPMQLTSNSVNDLAPRWSPDGRYIAFYRVNASTGLDIYVFDTLRHTQRQLTRTDDDDSYPDWTSDGQYVLFSRNSSALYRISPTGALGSEQLVAANWGTQVDSFAQVPGHWRVLIGASGSDWGGTNPPLGTSQPLALVGLDDGGLSTAVSCLVTSPQSSAVIEPVPDTGERVVVARVSGTNGVSQVWEDNGPGVPVTKIVVEKSDGAYAGSILLVFAAETGRLSSVIPVHEEAWTSGVGQGSVRAELKGKQVLLHAPATAVYVPEPGGRMRNLAPGGAQVVVLNAATGQPLAVH